MAEKSIGTRKLRKAKRANPSGPSVRASTTLTVRTTAPNGQNTPTPAGTYTLTVFANGGGSTQNARVTLIVTAPPAPGGLQGTIQ